MAKTYTFMPKNTFVENINPVVKIWGVFCLGLSALIFPNCYLGFGITVVLFVIAYLSKIFKSFSKIVIGFGIPITVMLLFIQGLYSPKNVTIIADLGFAQLGLEGVMYALKIVSTLLVFLGSFYIMNTTTYTGKLVAGLTSTGMNSKIGYLVLASLNVVPQMQRRMQVIQEAQNARGVELGGSLISRIKAYIPLLGPVVLSSLTDAQERGMTLETRGFGHTGIKQTSYVDVPYTRTDKIIKYGMICFLLVIIVIRILTILNII